MFVYSSFGNRCYARIGKSQQASLYRASQTLERRNTGTRIIWDAVALYPKETAFNSTSPIFIGGPVVRAEPNMRPRLQGGIRSVAAVIGFYYVVKFQNNPQDTRVLANEMLATRLAQRLGIPVPEPAVIEVSSWLVEHTEELHCQLGGQRIPCVSGLCFGSRFIVNPSEGAVLDYLPGSVLCKVANLGDFARVLVFDKWTCNSDGRQAIFARAGSHYNATFIDHGYCFNAGE